MSRLLAGLRKPSPIWWSAAVAAYALFALDLVGH